jgi:hypothetical protein
MPSERKRLLDRTDLIDHLKRQKAFLGRSSHAFDAGAEDEAVRLATVIRVLVHDTPNSTSLLTHLGVKEQLTYVDTAERINPANLLPTPGLIMMRMSTDEGGRYVAPLDNLSPSRIHPNKSFKRWCEDPVTKDKEGSCSVARITC